MRNIATLLIIAATAGCAAPPRVVAPLDPTPLVCGGPEECTLFWRRAQVWVTRHSTYKLQTISDTVIATHGPTRYSVDRAYQVTRIPGTDGRDEIVLESGCANLFGCSTGRDADDASFKQYVRTGR
jgi:hypothetical protein